MRTIRVALALCVMMGIATAGIEDDLRDGDRHFDEGNWSKAAAAYDRAISKGPGQVSAEAYGKRAAIYIITKDYAGGLAFINRTEGRLPNAPEILEQKALILWETDKRDDAIKVAEKVVAQRPQTFTNQKLIGEYYASRDPARTTAAYEAYLGSRPTDLEGGDVLPRIRLGFAYLATARTAISESDDSKAKQFYERAADQFDVVQKKHGKRPNAQTNADNGLCAAFTGLGRFDQAVTVCEKIAAEPKKIDATGSVWFNLGTSYLARKQTKKARTAALEFTKVRKTEARGFILLGDTYFADREFAKALEEYLKAEKLLRAGQTHDQVSLSIKLGKTYRRLPHSPGPSGAPNPNVALAIEKLSAGYNANPASTELAIELGNAYLEGKQDAKATQLTDKLLAGDAMAKAAPEARAGVLVIAGKALFNQHKLKEARQRFEAAAQVRSGDVQIQRSLVLVINEQAFEAGKDGKAAQAFLEQALPVDPNSPVTITNLAVLAIDRGDCDAARPLLQKLEGIRGHDTVLRSRLFARTFLCGTKPDPKRASEAYAAAEKEAKKANAASALAEIYTEWAPLLLDTDLAGAVEKLESAVATAASDPEAGPAAKRNLALALYRRGWKAMREGRSNDATSDFERAQRDPGVLRGTEPLAFEFSLSLAQLDAGRTADAAKGFRGLAAKGNQGSYLKPPYAKVGTQFFSAYANYRSGTLAGRQQAAAEFARLENEPGFGDKIRDLIASSWESIAFEQWRTGQTALAQRSLQAGEKYATGDMKRRITLDKSALSLGKADLPALEALAGNPPESLVNLGILYDQLGRPKEAYEAWTKAKARGVNAPNLQKWIDAKKRIYGF